MGSIRIFLFIIISSLPSLHLSAFEQAIKTSELNTDLWRKIFSYLDLASFSSIYMISSLFKDIAFSQDMEHALDYVKKNPKIFLEDISQWDKTYLNVLTKKRFSNLEQGLLKDIKDNLIQFISNEIIPKNDHEYGAILLTCWSYLEAARYSMPEHKLIENKTWEEAHNLSQNILRNNHFNKAWHLALGEQSSFQNHSQGSLRLNHWGKDIKDLLLYFPPNFKEENCDWRIRNLFILSSLIYNKTYLETNVLKSFNATLTESKNIALTKLDILALWRKCLSTDTSLKNPYLMVIKEIAEFYFNLLDENKRSEMKLDN